MGNPPGSDVFDAPGDVAGRLRMGAEVQDEGPVGRQLECRGPAGRVPP